MRINFTNKNENQKIKEIEKILSEAFSKTEYKFVIVPNDYEKNKEKIKKYHKEYYEKNKEKVKKYHKEYNERKKQNKIA